MAELDFTCLDVRPERYGAGPRLLFRLRIAETTGEPVHSIALRCQILVEPDRRDYEEREAALLGKLFGGTERWGESLRPMRFGTVEAVVPAFVGETAIELPVPCTYDMEVASGQYFRALDDGVVPLVLLFSGTISGKSDTGFWVRQLPWNQQATYELPVRVWDELMDFYFPRSTWVRLRADTVDALSRYKARQEVSTWDGAIATLLDAAGER